MKNIIKALTKNITEDNFSEIDSILEEIHTGWKYSQEQVDWYYELLQEATLYAELKETEYKEEYLKIISEK